MLSCYVQEILCVGHTYGAPPAITMRNAGGTAWTKAAGYALDVLDPAWGVSRIELADGETIQPSESKTFIFNPVGPTPSGQFGGYAQLKFRMAHGATEFGDATPDGIQQWITYCGG